MNLHEQISKLQMLTNSGNTPFREMIHTMELMADIITKQQKQIALLEKVSVEVTEKVVIKVDTFVTKVEFERFRELHLQATQKKRLFDK